MEYIYQKLTEPSKLSKEIANSSIKIALDYINTQAATTYIYFKDNLSVEDKTTLDTIVENHINEPLPEEVTKIKLEDVEIGSTEHALKVTPTKLEGSSTMLVSHNFCDATTWYTESEKVTSETLTVSGGDNKIFVSLNKNWIDLTHGKVPYEHRLAPDYPVVISVDDVPTSSGFTINYSEGVVVFSESQTGVIKATYNCARGSGWYIKPDSGKILKVIGTDVKFTEDAMLDQAHAISFQLYIMNGAVPYGSPTIYNNMEDMIKCSHGIAYEIPPFSIFNKRVIVLPFDYITSKDIPSSIGALIKIKLANGDAIPGTFGMVIAHCISIDE